MSGTDVKSRRPFTSNNRAPPWIMIPTAPHLQPAPSASIWVKPQAITNAWSRSVEADRNVARLNKICPKVSEFTSKVKIFSYVARYPVCRTTQKNRFTLHPLTDQFIPIPIWLLWDEFSHTAITARRIFTHIFPPLSMERTKMSNFETVAKGIWTQAPSIESGALPLTELSQYNNINKQLVKQQQRQNQTQCIMSKHTTPQSNTYSE